MIKYFFDEIKNNIDFFLRNHIGFSRKNYCEKPQNKDDIKSDLENKYDLSLLKNSTRRNYLENLYFLNVFDKYFKDVQNDASVLDIGSKNWSYAKSEYIFFNSKAKNVNLTGIELDSNRLNTNFYSRYEIAKYHIKNLSNTKYIAGDLMKHQGSYNYVIWILPFIVDYPHVKWGLPLKYFQPENMLLCAYELLNKNGEMLIINQGEYEYEIQKELNKKLSLQAQYFGEIPDLYNIFNHKRYLTFIKK